MKVQEAKQKCRHRNAATDRRCKAWAQPTTGWCWSHNPDQRALRAHGRLSRLEQGALQARARLQRLERERRIQ